MFNYQALLLQELAKSDQAGPNGINMSVPRILELMENWKKELAKSVEGKEIIEN